MKKLILLFLLLGIIAGIAFILIKQPFLQSTKGISGIINLNGVAPAGSVLTVSQRQAGTNDPLLPFVQNVPAIDGNEWNFPEAKDGYSYEIKAVIIYNNTVLTQGTPITVTAPATNEVLTFNVASEDLAEANIATPTPGGNSIISGTIGINGYIPQGATITIEGRSLGKQTYTTIAQNLAAVDNQVMTYTTAIPGQTYEVRGFLYDQNGTQIGSSEVITITAPAMNETLNINSQAVTPTTPTPATQTQTATPQVTQGAISGTINFNGQPQPNTRIVIFQRVSGTSQYLLAQDNVQPVNGTQWSWAGANVGTSYDLIAILKQKQNDGTDKDISNANTITVSAPASNEIFSINSGFTLPAASGNITVACNNYTSGSNTWQAAVSFESIDGAQSYWYQIGTTNGGDELTNSTDNDTNNPTQSYNYTFQNNTTYYARYAYGTVPNLLANSSQFSPFSGTQQLRCSN